MVCPSFGYCEAVVSNQIMQSPAFTERHASKSAMNTAIFDGKKVKLDDSPFGELADHIFQYSGRSLTYADDMLIAFREVLNRTLFTTYYGMMIAQYDEPWPLESIDDCNLGFARGLAWLPSQSLIRRPNFPSWS
jgi:hypothetical protein